MLDVGFVCLYMCVPCQVRIDRLNCYQEVVWSSALGLDEPKAGNAGSAEIPLFAQLN